MGKGGRQQHIRVRLGNTDRQRRKQDVAVEGGGWPAQMSGGCSAASCLATSAHLLLACASPSAHEWVLSSLLCGGAC
jgi:hypothetical protein